MTYGKEELINKLRYCGNAVSCLHCPYWEGCAGSKEYLTEAADAIEELRKAVLRLENESGLYDELPTVYIYPTKWISVEERLPEFKVNDSGVIHTSTVLYRRGKEKTVHLGYVIKTTVVNSNTEEIFVFNRWYDQHGELWEDVTHWMPLPEPPKDGE